MRIQNAFKVKIFRGMKLSRLKSEIRKIKLSQLKRRFK